MAKRPAVVSLWHCELCRVTVAVQGRPARQRHRVCRHWMTFLQEIRPNPAQAAEVRQALLAMARLRGADPAPPRTTP